jgi:predicted PurR-regulated permease PerM
VADSHATLEDTQFVRRAVEAAIRIGVLALLAAWSFMIMRPFIMPIMWGVIIAVAVFPAYGYLTAKLGGRRRLTASLITVLALALLLVPSVRFFGGTFDAVRGR